MNYNDHDFPLGYKLIPTGYLFLSRDVLSDESKDLDKVKCFYWFCSIRNGSEKLLFQTKQNMLTVISINQSVHHSCCTHLCINNFFLLKIEEVIDTSFEQEDDTDFYVFGCLNDNENEV